MIPSLLTLLTVFILAQPGSVAVASLNGGTGEVILRLPDGATVLAVEANGAELGPCEADGQRFRCPITAPPQPWVLVVAVRGCASGPVRATVHLGDHKGAATATLPPCYRAYLPEISP